jgi:hypothetical protein
MLKAARARSARPPPAPPPTTECASDDRQAFGRRQYPVPRSWIEKEALECRYWPPRRLITVAALLKDRPTRHGHRNPDARRPLPLRSRRKDTQPRPPRCGS